LPEKFVGLIFAGAALLAIWLLILAAGWVKRFGILAIASAFTILDLVALFILATGQRPLLLISAFLFFSAFGYCLRYTIDLYLENFSDDQSTGSIRGIYLTAINLAWLASPFLAGQLIEQGGYSTLFLLALLSTLPLLALLPTGHQNEILTATPSRTMAWLRLKEVWRDRRGPTRDLYDILRLDFLLNFFYAIMVIYTAVYLQTIIQLSAGTIGIAFTIMLIPFVVVDYPLGRLADKLCGEKEIMLGGLILMILATATASFITSTSLFWWAGLLLLTRIGAASFEIMKESYLFKKIGPADGDIIFLSRANIPFSYLIGPLFATVFLLAFPLKYIFVILAIVLLLGLPIVLKLRDTR
jgi:MFS family permease